MTCGDPADPTILHRSHLRGATFPSSFSEEVAAMRLALEWATTNHSEHSHTICTDSQSLLKAIERQSPVTYHVRSLLNARRVRKPSCGYQGTKESLATNSQIPQPKQPQQPLVILLGPFPMHP